MSTTKKAEMVFELSKENVSTVTVFLSSQFGEDVAKRLMTGYGLVIGDLRKNPDSFLVERKESQRATRSSQTDTVATTHKLSKVGAQIVNKHKAKASYIAARDALAIANKFNRLAVLVGKITSD